MRTMLLVVGLLTLPGCFGDDKDDDGGGESHGREGDCPTAQDEDECWEVGYEDGINGESPNAASWQCSDGDCYATYCNGYCEGELYAYGDYFECGDC